MKIVDADDEERATIEGKWNESLVIMLLNFDRNNNNNVSILLF